MSGASDPAHAAHAIERVSAVVALQEGMDGNEWLKVSRALEQCAKKFQLDKYEDVVSFAAQIPPPSSSFPAFSMNIVTGSRFVKKSSQDEYLISIGADRHGVQIESRQYIRWSGFQEMLSELVQMVVSVFPDSSAISQLRLDYLDRFTESSLVLPRASWREVLREGDHISPEHLDRRAAWHTHVGWFEESKDIGRLLLNLNIDASEETSSTSLTPRSISIYSLVSSVTPIPSAGSIGEVMKRFDILHRRSKVALRTILTPAMQNRISLNVDEKSS